MGNSYRSQSAPLPKMKEASEIARSLEHFRLEMLLRLTCCFRSLLPLVLTVRKHRRVFAVGAGIAYWECLHIPLAETLAGLCVAGGEAVIGHFQRDWKVERRFWTKVLPRHGLQAVVVWEGELG